MDNKPIALDLFCGCGGTTQGLRDAGFTVVGAIDIDPYAISTYEINHPEVKVWKQDIRSLKELTIKRSLHIRKGELDLLVGCPPCQGFSSMRTLNGKLRVNDPRNDLLLQFQQYVESFRPKAIMLENVPGLASDERFNLFCQSLFSLGYKGKAAIFNAADYGVPQRRRRLIYIAGYKREIPFGDPITEKITVRDAIGNLPPAGSTVDELHKATGKRSERIQRRIERIKEDGGSRADLPEEDQLECHKRCNGFKDVYGRMAWDDVSPTITGGCFNPSKGRFLHPVEHRPITLREAAILQGFPADYKFPQIPSVSAIALLIGNAFPPPLIAVHAKSIYNSLLAIGKSKR